MTQTGEEKQFVPLFPGTDPKSVMQGQRQFCLSELGAGAKRLADIEAELAKLNKQHQEVGDTLDKIEENYNALRSAETQVVIMKEYEYVRMQFRDFSDKCAALEGQIALLESAAKKEREACETMRKNVIFLEEKLSTEAKVIPLHGTKRQRNQG